MDIDLTTRLLIAALLGAVIGAEREATGQPAGLRTHISVALGAAVFGIISTTGFDSFVGDPGTTNVRYDPTRVASQVVVGIGFLGAGMIFRQGSTIKNLTTAASLWVTAAIGLASGVGSVGLAAAAAFAMLVSLALLRIPGRFISEQLARETERLEIEVTPADVDGLRAGLDRCDLDIRLEMTEKIDGNLVLVCEVTGRATLLADGIAALAERDDVVSLRRP